MLYFKLNDVIPLSQISNVSPLKICLVRKFHGINEGTFCFLSHNFLCAMQMLGGFLFEFLVICVLLSNILLSVLKSIEICGALFMQPISLNCSASQVLCHQPNDHSLQNRHWTLHSRTTSGLCLVTRKTGMVIGCGLLETLHLEGLRVPHHFSLCILWIMPELG